MQMEKTFTPCALSADVIECYETPLYLSVQHTQQRKVLQAAVQNLPGGFSF